MIAQLQSGNSKLRKDFVNKFLTNNEKMETTGSKFENIAQILSSENIRKNVYSKTGFVFKPEMLNDRHSKEITYDKKKSFSSVKNIFDTRDNTKLHLSPPNSHSNLRLLIKNKNPFVKEIKHNSIIKTVRSSKIGIKKIKENFKNSNIQSSRNANINSEIKRNSHTNLNQLHKHSIILTKGKHKGHNKSAITTKSPIVLSEKKSSTHIKKIKSTKKLSNSTVTDLEYCERRLYEIKDIDTDPVSPSMIKLNKAPTLTHRYKSSKYNPNLSSASKVKPSDCRKDKPNGKMKNDNKSYSKVSFSSNISIPNLKPLSNKEITHALYYDSEIEDSKQFIKNKYRTLLEHFSSN